MPSPLGELVAQEAEIDAEHAQLVLEVIIGFASIQRHQNAGRRTGSQSASYRRNRRGKFAPLIKSQLL
jgi:hypothetical protein